MHLILLSLLAGCVPRAPFHQFAFDLNEELARSLDEQLLLNLMRLHQGATPFFMTPGTVSADLSYSRSLGGSLGAGFPDGSLSTGASISGSRSVSPSVQWEVLRGKDLSSQYYTEVSLQHLTLLLHSDWNADWVFRLVVERYGEARNVEDYPGEVPEHLATCDPRLEYQPENQSDPYLRFLSFTCVLRNVQAANGTISLVQIANEDEPFLVLPAPLNQEAALTWLQAGYRLEPVREATEGGPQLGETLVYGALAEHYELQYARAGEAPVRVTVRQDGEDGEDGQGGPTEAAMVLRSFADIAYAAAQQLDIESADPGSGSSSHSHPRMHMVKSERCPDDQAVSVMFDDACYSVPSGDDDQARQTRALFALVNTIYQLQASEVVPRTPILTRAIR